MSAPLSLVIERDLPFDPERVWRALTTPHLLAEWLMPNDFAPIPGQAFAFTADWGRVDCVVLAIEEGRRLRYSWSAFALRSEVTFDLAPTPGGTRLRIEQSGFDPAQRQEFQGARGGWTRFADRLTLCLSKMTGA